MKKINRITSLFAAAAMALSMSSAINASAEEKTPAQKQRDAAYEELFERSKTFRVDDAVFAEKYNSAKERIENNPSDFDLSVTRPYSGAEIDYADYQCMRDYINELYSKDGFQKYSFTMDEAADYNRVRCDVDGDGELSYYDYCSVLRYAQEQLGLTEEDTDFTNNANLSNAKLTINNSEGWITINQGALQSDKTDITLPSEICVKLKIRENIPSEQRKESLVDAWCILPVAYIEEGAFDHCENMTSLTINNYIQPKWFKLIGKYNCEEELYKDKGGLVTIPTGGTVSDSTFININDNAFRKCKKLEKVYFQENVNFSTNAFYGTKFGDSTDNIYQASNGIYYVKSSVREKGAKGAKAACYADPDKSLVERNGIYNLDIEEGTTTITDQVRNAFYYYNSDKKVSLNIPSTVKYIHKDAFSSCGYYDCSSIKWVNGKTFDSLGIPTSEQTSRYDQEKLAEILNAEAELKEFLRNNNGSFKYTDFMDAPVQKIIDDKVAEIKGSCHNEQEMVMAVCRYIFAQADYTSYNDNINDFSLFQNGDYNTLDASRENIYAATNAFLTDHTECESFSMAVSLLLDGLGIKNYMLGCTGHAYNCVYYYGQWHIIDMSAYGDFDCNEALYDRISSEENTSFINDVKVKFKADADPHNNYSPGYNLYYMESWYPEVNIAGKSKVSPFSTKDMITYDVGFNIISVDPGQNCMTVALPGDENKIPQPIKDDIKAGRIKVYEANGLQKINGKYYYYVDNKMVSDEGWNVIDGKKYYIKSDCSLAYNEEVKLKIGDYENDFQFGKDFNLFNGLYIKDGHVCYSDSQTGVIKNVSKK